MPRYAQVNMETGIVESDSFLRDAGMEKDFPQLIPIDDGFDLNQKKWDFEKQEWVEYIPPEPENPEEVKPDEV